MPNHLSYVIYEFNSQLKPVFPSQKRRCTAVPFTSSKITLHFLALHYCHLLWFLKINLSLPVGCLFFLSLWLKHLGYFLALNFHFIFLEQNESHVLISHFQIPIKTLLPTSPSPVILLSRFHLSHYISYQAEVNECSFLSALNEYFEMTPLYQSLSKVSEA